MTERDELLADATTLGRFGRVGRPGEDYRERQRERAERKAREPQPTALDSEAAAKARDWNG